MRSLYNPNERVVKSGGIDVKGCVCYDCASRYDLTMEKRQAKPRLKASWLLLPPLVAFVLFLTYLNDLRSQPFFRFLVANPLVYDQQARDLLRGIPSSQPFFLSPLYPGFVATIYFLTRGGHFAVAFIQGILLAIDVYLVGLLGHKIFDLRVGLLAAFMMTFYWSFYYFAAELLPAILCVTLLLASTLGLISQSKHVKILMAAILIIASCGFAAHIAPLLHCLRGASSGYQRPDFLPNCLMLSVFTVGTIAILGLLVANKTPRGLLGTTLAGLLSGIATIVWSGSLIYIGILSLWLTRRSRKVLAVWLIGVCIPIAASLTHNYSISHRFIPLTTSAGVNLFIGNNPASDGMDPFRFGEGDEVRIEADRLGLSGAERSAFFRKKAGEFITSHPIAWLRLLGRKLILALAGFEIDNNADISERKAAWHLSRVAILNFGILFPLALGGIGVSSKKHPHARVLLIGFLSFASVCVIFFSCERFRIPGIALLIPLGAYGLVEILQATAKRSARDLAFMLALAAAGAIIANLDFLGARNTEFPSIIANKAYVARLAGDLATAEDLANQALQREPSNAGAYFQLGAIELARGNRVKAFSLFLDSLERDPFFYASYQQASEILREANISSSYLNAYVNSLLDSKDVKALREEMLKYLRKRFQQ